MTSIVTKNNPDIDDKEAKVLNEKSPEVLDQDTENSCSVASSIKEDTSGDSIEKVGKSKGEAMETKSCVDSLNSSIPELPVTVKRPQKIPILDPTLSSNKANNAFIPRRRCLSISKESLQFNLRPLVLATHLVPSLPVSLFEILAAIIEEATKTPVVLIHESRPDRPVAQDIVDIAILPVNKEWTTGILLPVGLVFEHHLNKHKAPGIYADVIIAGDASQNIEDIIDLRGHRCALPDRQTKIGATGLLFNYLNSKGEGASFFGDTLDADTQIAALHMVAAKQAEVGVLEAPVINCHKYNVPGVNGLLVLDSLGPLPPYQIMVNQKLSAKQRDDIKTHLLRVNLNKNWIERLNSYGILGFAEYSKENYNMEDIKSVVTSMPYY
ncbi:uncharacterized protein [Chelonus insularis]|nr:uncharacterized protein LOC118068342 isoform X2 [Chelonus insularis]